MIIRDSGLGVGKQMSEIADKIKRIVADHLGVDEAKVVPQASFIDDLGADSLDTVELVMVFEEELASKFPSMWLKKSPPSGTRSTTSKRKSRIGVLTMTDTQAETLSMPALLST
jgi:acyl carrier protein